MARRGHGEGTISKKKNGKWLAQVSIGTERFTKTLETRKDAVDWIRAQSDQVKNGLTSDGAKMTVEVLIVSWLKIKETKSRPATIEQYDRIRRLYINPHLGKLQLRELSAARIQSFYTILQSKNKGLRTIELCHIVLHGLLSHALRLGLIHRNWTEAVECPRPEKKEMQIWNESQVNQFLAATGNDIFYRFAFFTGMRRGELIGLQWKDVDWKNCMIKVERQVYKPMKGSFIIQPPKTKNGRRSIRLGPGLMEALSNHYKYTISRMIAIAGPDDWKDHDLIFPSSVGTPKNGYQISKDFKRKVAEVGLPEIRFHDIRHTAASIMIMYGIPPMQVAAILGQSVQVLFDTYAHYIPNDQEKISTLMDEITTTTTINLNPVKNVIHNPERS